MTIAKQKCLFLFIHFYLIFIVKKRQVLYLVDAPFGTFW